MNNEPPFINDNPQASTDFDAETKELLRRHAGTALLIALGLGVATAALAFAFRPSPGPRQRMTRLIADMEDRLRDVSRPAVKKVEAMATDGAHAFGERLHRREAQFEKFLRGAARRLHRLASSF